MTCAAVLLRLGWQCCCLEILFYAPVLIQFASNHFSFYSTLVLLKAIIFCFYLVLFWKQSFLFLFNSSTWEFYHFHSIFVLGQTYFIHEFTACQNTWNSSVVICQLLECEEPAVCRPGHIQDHLSLNKPVYFCNEFDHTQNKVIPNITFPL